MTTEMLTAAIVMIADKHSGSSVGSREALASAIESFAKLIQDDRARAYAEGYAEGLRRCRGASTERN